MMKLHTTPSSNSPREYLKVNYISRFLFLVLIFLSSYNYSYSQIPTTGLVAYYPFNGNASDESGNGNNGTIVGGVTSTADRFGNTSKAMFFDGSTGYITVPSSASLQTPTTSMTLTGWMLLDENNPPYDHVALVTKPAGSNYGQFHLMYHTYLSTSIHFYFDGGTKATGGNSGLLAYKKWYFVAATWDGVTAEIYLNNNKINSTAISGTITPDNNPVLIGLNTPGTSSYYTLGKLDDIRIYNRALSASEIDALYHEGGYADVTDIDGNTYNTVTIGTQTWMKENLKVTRYRNGEAIPNITNNTEWTTQTAGAYCWYNNDEATNKPIYGALYNYYTTIDGRGLCPTGWHVPTDVEWTTLETNLGGNSVAGGKLKSINLWDSPNTGADNSSGFTAIAGGYRFHDNGTFVSKGVYNHLWSSTINNYNSSIIRFLSNVNSTFNLTYTYFRIGTSIRCLKGEGQAFTAINTNATTNIAYTTANSGGNVTFDGGTAITSRGVCWSTSIHPTVDLTTKTIEAGTIGSFTSSISGLTSNTTYYIRAYSTNSIGTIYGNEEAFTTLNTNGLVAYYPFNGNAIDESGNGNNGTLNGGVAITSDRFGNANSAYSYDGVDDKIVVADNSNFNGSQITISTWASVSGTWVYDAKYIFAKISSTPNSGLSLCFDQNNSTYGTGNYGVTFRVATSTGFHDLWSILTPELLNGWKHIVGIVDNTTIRLYINGVEVKSLSLGESLLTCTNPIYFGAPNYRSDQRFPGKLDDFRIYNRALSASEVDALYHEGGYDLTPTITSFTPSSGLVGSSVTITGTNFGTTQGTSTIKFGITSAIVTSWSDTHIVVTVPSIVDGDYTISVTIAGVTVNSSTQFTVSPPYPLISSVSPMAGIVGSSVTINGTNFGATQGTSTAKFETTAATVTSWSDNKIIVKVPNLVVGNYTIYVVTTGGTASSLQYTVNPSPTILSIDPISAKIGATITLTGFHFENLQGLGSVKVGTTDASVISWADNQIQFIVPTISVGVYDIFVKTSAGISTYTSNFVVCSTPVIKKKGSINILVCQTPNATSYQWYLNNTAIANATKQFYVARKNYGSYSVQVVESNGCNDRSNAMSISTSSSVSVYPNPSDSEINVVLEFEETGLTTIRVVNSLGNIKRIITIKKDLETHTQPINIEGLEKGIYFIEVEINQEKIVSQKVVIL